MLRVWVTNARSFVSVCRMTTVAEHAKHDEIICDGRQVLLYSDYRRRRNFENVAVTAKVFVKLAIIFMGPPPCVVFLLHRTISFITLN